MNDFWMMVAAFFVALLGVAILGRFILVLAILLLVGMFGLIALVVAVPFCVIGLMFGKRINIRRCWDWDWDDDDDDEDNLYSDTGSISINGVLMKCDKCDRNACSVSGSRRRCSRHN